MENNKNVYLALLEAQKEFETLKKTETATVPTKGGGQYSYHYVDLESVLSHVLPILHKHGLVLTQTTDVQGDNPVVVTSVVLAESQDAVTSTYPLVSVDRDDPQKLGASLTYARRYALLAMLGIATEDDDAMSASRNSSSGSKSSPAPVTDTKSGEVYTDPESTPDGECSYCGAFVKGKSVYWSNKKHGRTLCWDDQQKADRGELGDPKNDVRTRNSDEELDDLYQRSVL